MTVLEVRLPPCAGCAHPLIGHHGPPEAAVDTDPTAAGQMWLGGGCAVAGCTCPGFVWPEPG